MIMINIAARTVNMINAITVTTAVTTKIVVITQNAIEFILTNADSKFLQRGIAFKS